MIFTILIVVIVSLAFTIYHLMYTADTVAKPFGYFIFIAVLPALVGGIIGMIGILALRNNIPDSIKELWWLPTVGAATSLALVCYVVLMMSLPGH